ncbi:MAG TPA: acyl-CoA desaturase, partial [Candidatus Thermoplasmatota archaeon]|nr:acyl-CoA desaturase [Candidatus Thermoplasmatota archaeon]
MSDARLPQAARKAALLATVVLPLLATAYAIRLLWNRWVTPVDLALLAVMHVATAIGIGVGFHRMLTHRSFETPAPVRAVLLALGSMALQGPAIEWAATHAKHHAKADREGDPHSPLEGFWHAHVGWIFRDRFVRSGVWAKPYEEDRVTRAIDRTFGLWAVLGFAIPGAVGYAHGGWHGFWTGVLWGGLVRVFLGHHITWSVNSVCHTFGRRAFRTTDRSRNEWVVGLLALGEGWHNNHHAFPKAAYHGMRWWQVDVNGLTIRALAAAGLARRVWMPRPAEMEARRVPRASRRRAR